MTSKPIKIQKNKGDFAVISVRIKTDTLEKVDKLSWDSNRSRNELINILLKNAVENAEVEM